MRKIISLFVLSSLLGLSAAHADTIHLKNGSVLKGKVASYGDDQFIVMLDTGSGRYMSRAMIYVGDVARIEFDSAPAGASDSGNLRDSSPPASNTAARDTAPTETSRDVQPVESTARKPISDPPTSNPRETTPPQEDRTNSVSNPPPSSNEDTSEAISPKRKGGAPVKTTSVDVSSKRDWTSTGLIIKAGDRIRITATGSVVIDSATGQTSGPEGTDLTDAKKLMGDRPTGSLIAVIGADNDEFIHIGRSAEFVARRGGLLFLSVNEGTLSDNSGAFKASIELQSQR